MYYKHRGTIIEHDVIIEDNCHISTGAIINGGTVVRRNSFVGSNAMAKEYIEVGEDCIIRWGGGDEELTKRDSSKGKDLKIAKEHWEKQETVSLKDRNLRELERFSIINQLKKIKPTTLADIGCGDCSDTIYYSDYVENIFAFDYSETMLRKAAKIVSNKRIKLSKFDILKEAINIKVDIITTKRCLINLGTFENQKDAIRKIHDSLNKDGYYLMLECSLDGLNNLNILRQKVALNPIPSPFHNLYFELNDLMSFIQDFLI